MRKPQENLYRLTLLSLLFACILIMMQAPMSHIAVAQSSPSHVYLPLVTVPSSPPRPSELTIERIANVPLAGTSIAVVDGLAYISEFDALSIFDIRTPSQPVQRARLELPGSFFTFDSQIADGLLYMAVGSGDFNGLYIVDIHDAANPVLRGTYATSGTAFGVTVVEQVAYVAADRGVSAPSGPEDDPVPDMHIVDVSDPANPVRQGNYSTAGDANSVAVVDHVAYVVASGEARGLQIIDVNDVSNPILRGSYMTLEHALDVSVVGDLAYIAAGVEQGLQIVDVRDPAHPTLRGSVVISGTARLVRVVDTLAYVGTWQQPGLQIVDVRNPANPVLQGSYEPAIYGLAVVADHVYLVDQEGSLRILRISTH